MTPREEIKAAYKNLCAIEKDYVALVERHATDPVVQEMHGVIAEFRKDSRRTFPVEITAIRAEGFGEPLDGSLFGSAHKPGVFVKVRPCDDECEGKTYFGILLGDLAVGIRTRISEGGVLSVGPSGNPGIWVPALGRIIYGHGSWWGEITDPEDVREITDDTIQNVWYVKALKAQFAESKTGDDSE